ncbi:MAG: SufD family Fe-S cluster assembly protein [bacterium]|nr:SufD family Fe-S cluster assembly protein [bacterium]
MDERKREVIRELGNVYEEYDKKFPAWLKKSRSLAREIYLDYEERGFPACRFGVDFDLLAYRPDIGKEHPPRRSLDELSEDMKRRAESAGQSISEHDRTGTRLQEDATTTYLSVTSKAKQTLFSRYPDGLIVEDIEDAVLGYSWIEKLWSHIYPINLDKYTAYNAGYSRGGVFVWVKQGVKVELPLQICFFVETQMYAQLPRILVIAEPHSRLHLISGCLTQSGCNAGLHGCITEIYVGEGAEVTYSMIHNFGPEFHVRPKIGAIVEKDATYIENLIIIGPCKSDQAYPTAVLRGEGAKAVIRCIILGVEQSSIDVGSAIIFSNEGTRAELISRAVATDESKIKMRGNLKSYAKRTKGHLECRGLLLSPLAQAWAYPQLRSISPEADLTHEAAIGKIADEELYYLMSRGLTENEATSMIARGFLDVETPGFPPLLRHEIDKVISTSLKRVL